MTTERFKIAAGRSSLPSSVCLNIFCSYRAVAVIAQRKASYSCLKRLYVFCGIVIFARKHGDSVTSTSHFLIMSDEMRMPRIESCRMNVRGNTGHMRITAISQSLKGAPVNERVHTHHTLYPPHVMRSYNIQNLFICAN